jgi:hypothetical protein
MHHSINKWLITQVGNFQQLNQCFSTYGYDPSLGHSYSEWVLKQFHESTYYHPPPPQYFDKFTKEYIFLM